MSIVASQLVAAVTVQGASQAARDLIGVGAASDTAGGRLRNLATVGTLMAGAAVVDLGLKSIKMAGDFESSTTTLVTGAGELQSNLDKARQGILKIAVDTGTSTGDLVKSMFLIDSAGYTVAKGGLAVLTIAAEGSKVAHSDLTKTTDVLTTSLHDYHLAASQAIPVMNSLITTEKHGKMTMDDLIGSMTNVLPVSASLHIKLSDIEGALSTMAASGDKGAAAGTHLAMMLKMLADPTGKASKEMSAMGIDSIKLAETMRTSLPGALQMIQEAVARHFVPGSVEYSRAISTILGGSKSGIAGLELMGQSLSDFQSNANAAADSAHHAGNSVQNWSDVQKDFNLKLDRAREMVEVLGISVGTKLLPIAGKLVDDLGPLVQGFTDLVNGTSSLSDQSGVLQPILQAIHDILPDIGTFLTQAGDSINQNLLPPLGDLVTNVGLAVDNFSTWLDKSGTAKSAIADLGTAVNITSQVLGTMVEWTAQLVGFLAQDTPASDALKVSIGLLGLAFVGLKLADTVSGFQQMFSKLSEGNGIVQNLASSIKDKLAKSIDDFLGKQFPNLKKGLDGIKGSASDAAAAEEKVGTTAEGDMASGVEKGSTASETQLGNVEAQANAASDAEGGIGTASGTAATEVTASSLTMEGDLQNVGLQANIAKGEVAATGPAMQGAAATGVGAFAGFAGSILSLGISAIAFLEYMLLKDAAAAVIKSAQDPNYKPPSGPGGVNPRRYASGTSSAEAGWNWVGEQGPELMYTPGGSQILSHNQSMGMAGGYSGPRQIILQVDRRTLGSIMLPEIVDQIRYGVGVHGL